jgi:TP901 family phage tail tape measure protein
MSATTVGSILVSIGADLSELEKGLKSAGDKLSSFGTGMKDMGASLTAGVTLPLAAIGAGLLKVGSDFEEATAIIRAGTGATGESLEALKGDFSEVFKELPVSADQAATIIADLNTRLGLTGEPLQEMAELIGDLGKVTGQEFGPLVADATRLMGDWGIANEDAAQAMNFMWNTAQTTGITVEELNKKLVQFGAPLRQMGFSMEEAAVMLGKFEKEGVNTELVLGSLKIALGKMAQDGVTDPAAKLREIIEEIKNAGTAGEANAIALEHFGSRAGPDMAATIREGRLEIAELLSTIQSSSETIDKAAADTETLSDKFTILKNNLYVAIEPLAGALMDAIEGLMPAFKSLMGYVEEAVKIFSSLPTGTQQAILALAAVAAAAGPVLIVLGTLVTSIAGLLPILAGIVGALEGIAVPAAAVAAALAAIAVAAAAVATGFITLREGSSEFQQGLSNISEKFQELNKKITELSSGAIEVLIEVFGKIYNEVIPSLTETFTGLIENILPPVMEVFETIAQIITDVVSEAFRFLAEDVIPIAQSAFEEFWPPVEGIIQKLAEIVQEVFPYIAETVQKNLERVGEIFAAVWPVVRDLTLNTWETLKGIIAGALTAIEGVITVVLGLIKGDFSEVWEGIELIVSGVLKSLYSSLEGALNNWIILIGGILNVIVTTFQNAWNWVIEDVGRAFDNVYNYISSSLTSSMGLLESFIGRVQDAINYVANLATGSSNIGSGSGADIPGFAKGIQNFKGGWAIVGEQGPELLKLPGGSTVYPAEQSKNMIGAGEVVIKIENMIVRENNDINLIARELENLRKSASRRTGAITI